MPGAEIFSKGYSLFYQHQQSNFTKKRILRSFGRAFRRGTFFARHYLKQFFRDHPMEILEVGAGSGYFAQGIRKVFPKANITYIDIVDDLALYYKMHFTCSAITGEFRASQFQKKKFDLVIARDLLEHLRDPHQFMLDVNAVLKPDGLFYFITPNGRENLWLINQAHIHGKKESLLFINHVHYFLAQVLDRLLSSAGFKITMGFKCGLKGHKKGLGHKTFNNLTEQKPPYIDSTIPIQLSSKLWRHDPKKITGSMLHGGGVVSRLYSSFRDKPTGRCNFYDEKGHEFFVLAEKKR